MFAVRASLIAERGVPVAMPSDLVFHHRHAVFRPQGDEPLTEGIERCADAIAYAPKNRIWRLIIDVTRLHNFEPRSIFDRFRVYERWSTEAQSRVIVAVVTRADLVDPEGFGATVARNRGMVTRLFTTEPAAAEWLADEYRR